MKILHLALLAIVLGASSNLAPSQDRVAGMETLMQRGKYDEALHGLIELRDKSVRIDSLIAICACHVPEAREDGLKMARWILDQSPEFGQLSPNLRTQLRTEAAQCGYSSFRETVYSLSPRPGQAGASIPGKLFHLLPRDARGQQRGEEYTLATDAITAGTPKRPDELAARVFPRKETGKAVEKIRLLVGTGFNVTATRSFVLASASGHSIAQLQEFGYKLEKAKEFLETTFNLPPTEELLTVYTLPSVESLQQFARRIHGLRVGKYCIGYSYVPDASIVAVIPRDRIGTLNHELVHSLISARYPELPAWLDEGLASLYEESRIDGDRLVGVWGWRQNLLREMWSLRPTIPALLAMGHTEFNRAGYEIEQQAVVHATARSLLLFAQDKRSLAAVFDAFRPINPLDPPAQNCPKTPVECMETILGTAKGKIDDEFVAWFRELGRLHPGS